MNHMTQEQLEAMYPDVYKSLSPLVEEAVEELLRTGHSPTKETFDACVEQIIRNSGLEDIWNQEAVATAGPVHNRPGHRPGPNRPGPNRPGHNHNRPGPGYRPRPPYHNHNTLQDVAGILLLNQLFGRGYYRPW